ncbi:MAG: helix-turn-helix transcriptional regulator [bacterium]|nr:helix-turn-helix transcriptional regulator [bacterium]
MLFDRRAGLWAVFGVQLACALFILGDTVLDVLGLEQTSPLGDSDSFEYVIAVALLLGVAVTGLQIKRMLGRQRRMENQLMAASGAFAELLETHFDAWNLTAAERDVALLSIKGLSIADMARLRQTKAGTIKAQCNAVYRKADVSGRPQLLSLFIEELMSENLMQPVSQTEPHSPKRD